MAIGHDDVERDYYATLGVSRSSTPAEVKKAYRKLARDLHPDKNPGDTKSEEKFKEVGRAYEILGDAATRKEYDEARQLFSAGGPRAGGRPGARNGAGPGGFNVDLGDLFNRGGGGGGGGVSDMFGGLFGGGAGSRGRAAQRGADIHAEVTVGFGQAMGGLEASVRLPGGAACDTCQGTGAKPGTTPHACPVCNGAGMISRSQGGFAFSEPCRNCHGSGTVIDESCPTCGGTGRRERVQKIRIPAGVKDGQRLRVRGRGEAGQRGGPPGDLEVTVNVGNHPVFGRDADRLTLRVPITFPEAALGATISVPTMGDSVSLKIPAGTTSGQRLRVKGKGFPTSGGGTGDLIVTVEVAVPANLSSAAKKALEDFSAAAPADPRADLTARAAAGS